MDVHTTQKLATRAYTAVNDWLVGKHGRPRFKSYRQLDSVECKSNASGIRWRDGQVKWLNLSLSGLIDPHGEVMAHGLSCRVKFVRLVRRKLRGKDRFYAQIVCEGLPYRKQKHRIGNEVVGLDLGPSTIGVVGESDALLTLFCEEVVRAHKPIRRLQRHIDRQRRQANPDNYLPDGRIKPGPKKWVRSKRQHQSEDRLR